MGSTDAGTFSTRQRLSSLLFLLGVLLTLLLAAAPVKAASPSRPSRMQPSATAGGNVILTGKGDEHGYHLFVSSDTTGWTWQPLLTLDPGAESFEPWIGYQCVTADGKYAVVVTAPRSAANDPDERDHGAIAYSIDLSSREAHPLASHVALMYFNPGCGAGHMAALSRYQGEERRTEVLLADAASGEIVGRSAHRGQITSAVPTSAGVIGAAGNSLVALRGDHLRVKATVPGQPFDLRPAPEGVQMLVAEADEHASVATLSGSTLQRGGPVPLYSTNLFVGKGGKNVLVTKSQRSFAGFRVLDAPRAGQALGASLQGDVVLATAPDATDPVFSDPRPSERLLNRSGSVLPGKLSAARAPVVTALPDSGGEGGARMSINTTTPKCAVPRLDLRRQVMQPNTAMVNWAIQQATRGNLKGSVLTRPANYANMGLASYSPSSDFAPVGLVGGGVVPPSVLDAVYAQESNWYQASWHALPGVAGGPLIADYYGANGGINEINYENADCGYGIGQVTTGMTAAATSPFSENGKKKIAVDYAENIAASIQILAQSWNQLANNGITLNGGNSQYLENWYFAIWAYNTGFHPNTGSGPWGLGWTNNPQNSSYPPNRLHFLRTSYEDAAHPANWPYQERVVGFMESPLFNYRGQRSYARPNGHPEYTLQIPGYSTFCNASNNCSPTYHNATNPELDYCQLASRECWWHQPVTYASCPTNCATSVFNVSETATEPANDPNYIPKCQSVLPAGTIIVDNQPEDLNLRGCTPSNWTSKGTFTVQHGTNSSGVPIGMIDWHQLGTGFGGHTYFTHNRPVVDTAHTEKGTWTPGTIKAGVYSVQAHVPDNGATAESVTYRIYKGDGTSSTRTINQHIGGNQWVPLGDYELKETGAKVELTNVNSEPSGQKDIAYDAMAFTWIANPRAQPQELATTFKPVLKFDTSEKWRPINLNAFFSETTSGGESAQHRCIPFASPDAQTILGESPTFAEKPGDYYSTVVTPNGSQQIDVSRCEPIGGISGALAWRSPDAYIDFGPLGHSDEVDSYRSSHPECIHNGLLDCNGGEVANDPYSASYYTITDSSGHTFIEYWYFYRYNSFSDSLLPGGSHHEGDWESVAIAPSADNSRFEYASFAQHGKWYSYLRAALSCADQSDGKCGTTSAPRGKRVVDFVSNGDHANYGYACSETVGVPPYPNCGRGDGSTLGERGHDGGKSWFHNASGQGLLPMPAIGAGTWIDWPGHWGATPPDNAQPWQQPGQASPQSPASQGMFQQPWGECGKDIGENTCALPSRQAKVRVADASTLISASRRCSTWFGGDVIALLCNPHELEQAVHDRGLDREGQARIEVRRGTAGGRRRATATRSASAEGIAQVLGPALRPGDAVVVHGTVTRGTFLNLRVAVRGHLQKRRLRLEPGDARQTWRVLASGRVRAMPPEVPTR
jgi:hypothetical protein